MLDGILLLWFVLSGGAVAFVAWDSLTNARTSWVQRLAWLLVTIYTGPIGVFVYLLACRNPGRGMHAAFTSASWKQAVNSEMHCLAGDATGIVIAAAIVPAFGLPNGVDLVLEYVSAFVVGLLVFQALMMLGMYGSYPRAVRKTFFAETVSMNTVMVGMIPVMVVLMRRVPGARDPLGPEFWFVMGMAAIAGGLTAYPVNWWLVTNHLKHGCMTLPEKGAPAAALGLMSTEEGSGHATAAAHATPHGQTAAAMPAHGEGHAMQMRELAVGQELAWVLGTFVLMLLAAWATSLVAPISFSR